MSKKEKIASMLDALIEDNLAQAQTDFHEVSSMTMRSIVMEKDEDAAEKKAEKIEDKAIADLKHAQKIEKEGEKKEVKEAWDKKDVVNPKEKGKYDGWSLSELEAERKKLMDKEKRTEAESDKVHELDFAIRAKKAHGGKWAGVKAK